MSEHLSIEEYLEETKYAAKSLIDLIFKEETKLKNIIGQISIIEGEINCLESMYKKFLGMEYDLDGYSDAQIQHSYIQWYKQQERMPKHNLKEAKERLGRVVLPFTILWKPSHL